MIGRFSKLGVYQELLRLRDFYVAFGAALFMLASYIVDRGSPGPSIYGIGLALIAVAVNGLPIIWGPSRGCWIGRSTWTNWSASPLSQV